MCGCGGLYPQAEIMSIPDAAIAVSAGCGNPTAIAELKPGMTVVDLGSGGGIDVFLAAKKVGPKGRAIGIDATPEMIHRARETASETGYDNVEFRLGEIEHMPLDAAIGRRGHQQLRDQPLTRQGAGLQGGVQGPEAGRQAGRLGHRAAQGSARGLEARHGRMVQLRQRRRDRGRVHGRDAQSWVRQGQGGGPGGLHARAADRLRVVRRRGEGPRGPLRDGRELQGDSAQAEVRRRDPSGTEALSSARPVRINWFPCPVREAGRWMEMDS